MKKILLTLTVALATTLTFAQGPFITLGAGYAGSASKDVIGSKTEIKGGVSTTTQLLGGFGAGIPINFSGGYMFNENVGAELGFTYLLGSEVTIFDFTNDAATGLQSHIIKTKGSSLRVIPSLVLTTANEGINVYTKAGIIVPVMGSTTFSNVELIDLGATNSTTTVEGESKGKFSFGYTGSAGVAYPLNENLSVFGELQMVAMRVKSNTQTYTKYDVDGVDAISDFKTYQKETLSVDELKSDATFDESKPSEVLRTTANYNSFGLNVGVKMSF